jgi:hypothetical protein
MREYNIRTFDFLPKGAICLKEVLHRKISKIHLHRLTLYLVVQINVIGIYYETHYSAGCFGA